MQCWRLPQLHWSDVLGQAEAFSGERACAFGGDGMQRAWASGCPHGRQLRQMRIRSGLGQVVRWKV